MPVSGSSVISEGLFRRNSETVGDIGLSGELFQQMTAVLAAIFARRALHRVNLDPPIAGSALWTLNVAFTHQ